MTPPPARFALDIGGTHLGGLACGAGPPVLFLHGFPDCAEAFVPMMEALGDRHFCVALDQRGHGTSDLADAPGSCTLDRLVADVAAVCDGLRLPVIDLVGHDWGGLVAWRFAERHPGRTRRLVTFNAPHPWCLQTALAQDRDQQARSAYVHDLRSPHAAQALAALDFAVLWTRFCGDPGETFRPDHRAALQAAWTRPGAWASMLRWYQDNPFHPGCQPPEAPSGPVTAPALMVWGEADPLFAASCLEGLATVAADCRRIPIPEGRHSVFRQDPARAASLVRAHLDPEHRT